MKVAIVLIIVISLLLMLWQDMQFRKIHIILPVIVFCCGAGVGHFPFFFHMKQALCNIGFLAATLSVLAIYLKLKSGKGNIFTSAFGLGDLLFYIGVAPLFLLRDFIMFFIYSLLVSIVLHFMLHKKASEKTVPLAGFASMGLLLIIIKDVVFGNQVFGTIITY